MRRLLYLGIIAAFCLTFVPTLSAAAEPLTEVSQQQPVNINTATLEALEALPGIGPVTAQRIIDYRTEHGTFTSVAQLVEIKGIGEKSLKKIRPLTAVE